MASHQATCDSYFVESHDDPGRIFRQDAKERERHVKRQTQLFIAEQMSRMASEEYREDVLKHMEKMELDTLADVASIEIQTEIQWYMRPYLLDFLIEAHTAFGLLPETLFLTINLLDRYCSRRVVYKRHYQLVGCAALLIASKYGDRKERVPTIKELKSMCCSLYDDDMFTQMEWHVLQTLNWIIGHPTIVSFIELALDGMPFDSEVENMACYISEIALFHKDFVSKRPSDMARASLALARCILDRPQARHGEWAAHYDSQTLLTLSQQLHGPSQVLSRKYATAPLSRVSATLEDFLARQASIARCYATPPTPPYEVSARKNTKGSQVNAVAGPYTPQKGQNHANMMNGCLTPPITPDIEHFVEYNPGYIPCRRPQTPTPTPLRNQPLTQQYSSQYQLPPIL